MVNPLTELLNAAIVVMLNRHSHNDMAVLVGDDWDGRMIIIVVVSGLIDKLSLLDDNFNSNCNSSRSTADNGGARFFCFDQACRCCA